MINKDRYSISILILFLSFIFLLILIRFDYFKIAAITMLSGFLPLFITLMSSAKIHLSDDQKSALDLEYKNENGCSFSKEYKNKIDGLKYNGKRYKASDGVDIFINHNNKIQPCGFGSAIIQGLSKAGYEPESIQNDSCWL